MDLDMEIRSGEAEDDAHLVGRQQDRIDDDAAGQVVQRQGQWHDLIAAPDPAHQVSALVAVEDLRNHVDGIDRPGVARDLVLAFDGPSRPVRIAVQIFERRREFTGREDLPDQLRQGPGGRIRLENRRVRRLGRRVEVGEEKLDPGIDADGCEDSPADRVEEGLGQLDILTGANQLGVGRLHRGPELLVLLRETQELADLGHAAGDDPGIELEPFERIMLQAMPVALLEANLGAAGRDLELALVVPERRVDRGGGLPGQPVVRLGDPHVACPRNTVLGGQDSSCWNRHKRHDRSRPAVVFKPRADRSGAITCWRSPRRRTRCTSPAWLLP